MTSRIGPWQIRQVRTEYENAWIRVDHHDVVRPDGADGVYGVIRFANLAVGVLPLFEDGSTVLVGQHRFPFDAYSWELPEGGCPEGETPEGTALRELAEETGLVAQHLAPLGQVQMSNSVTDEFAHYYVAWDLTEGEASPDPDEVLAQRRVPLSDVVEDIRRGAITDSLTVLMVQSAIVNAMTGHLPERPTALILEGLEGLSGLHQR